MSLIPKINHQLPIIGGFMIGLFVLNCKHASHPAESGESATAAFHSTNGSMPNFCGLEALREGMRETFGIEDANTMQQKDIIKFCDDRGSSCKLSPSRKVESAADFCGFGNCDTICEKHATLCTAKKQTITTTADNKTFTEMHKVITSDYSIEYYLIEVSTSDFCTTNNKDPKCNHPQSAECENLNTVEEGGCYDTYSYTYAYSKGKCINIEFGQGP